MDVNNFDRYAQQVEQQQNGIMNTLRRLNGNFPPVYLRTILDVANLNTLCRISEEFPRLRAPVNTYFSTHFRGKGVFVDESCCRRMDRHAVNFGISIQQVHVYGMGVNTLNYVSSHFPTPTKITFEDELIGDSYVPWERADILANTMRSVQTVVFKLRHTLFEGAIFDRLLHHARRNIRILIIDSLSTKSKLYDVSELNGTASSPWYSRRYPILTTLQWDDGITSNQLAFQRLLRNNFNIQHLIFTRNIYLVMDFLEEYDIKLLRLDVTIRFEEIESVCDRLNELFENGHFHQLYITCSNSDVFDYRLNELGGLKGITFHGEYIPAIRDSTQLIELQIDAVDDAGNGWDAALHLYALRTLYITRASLDAIIPFICAAPQMWKIVIRHTEVDDMGVESLNIHHFQNLVEQRARLPNAQRLKIYLDETAYCTLKPYENEYSTRWITILRIDELLNLI